MDSLQTSIGDFFKAVRVVLLAPFRLLLELIFQFWPVISIAHFVREKFPKLWDKAMGLGIVRKHMSIGVINRFANATVPRPHAHVVAFDYPSWDGFRNTRYTARHLPFNPAFEDAPKPDPAALEDLFMRGAMKDAQTDDIRSSVLFSSFAQWFTDSFLRTSHQLDLDADLNTQDRDELTFRRKDGREKYNDSNHEIDLCQIYGLSQAKTEMLRVPAEHRGKQSRDRGCLAFQMINGEMFPEYLLKQPPNKAGELQIKPAFEGLHPEPLLRSILKSAAKHDNGYETVFATGIEHGNSTIGNSLFNVIFLREHNRIAREIADVEDWDADRVFETARNTMIVLLLKVVVSDYIRHISPLNLPLGIYPEVLENANWYRPNRIHIEFNILYRWHSLVPDTFGFLPKADTPADNFAQFQHNNDWLLTRGVAATLDDLSRERAGMLIMGNTPDVLRGVKRDTLRLMRAARLDSYNAYRKRFGLERIPSFTKLTDDSDLARDLKAMYGHIDNVEWYIGLMAERHGHQMIMGDLMMQMVAHDAFTHALTNPLLAPDVYGPGTFGSVGWKVIEETTTLTDIVDRVVHRDPGQACSFAHVS